MRTHQNLPVDVDDGVVGIDGHQTIVGGVLDVSDALFCVFASVDGAHVLAFVHDLHKGALGTA